MCPALPAPDRPTDPKVARPVIVLSAVLVLVGLALLIAGLVSTGLALIYASLGVTVVAAILLLLGVRMSPSKRGGDRPPTAVALSAPAEQEAPAASDAQTGELEPVPAVPVVATQAPGTVVVVSGRPRYHRAECRFLANAGDEAEDISAEEARELGFTPCGVCKPDDQHGRSAEETDTRRAEVPPEASEAPTGAVNMDVSSVATTDSAGAQSDAARSAASDAARAPVEKSAAKKAPAKKAAAKKAPAKKAAAKKAPAKKAAATKAPAKKTAAKKAAAKKTAAKKTAAKKTAAKKAPAKNAPAKKAAAKKAPGRPSSTG
jgi:hypothetical protein